MPQIAKALAVVADAAHLAAAVQIMAASLSPDQILEARLCSAVVHIGRGFEGGFFNRVGVCWGNQRDHEC